MLLSARLLSRENAVMKDSYDSRSPHVVPKNSECSSCSLEYNENEWKLGLFIGNGNHYMLQYIYFSEKQTNVILF